MYLTVDQRKECIFWFRCIHGGISVEAHVSLFPLLCQSCQIIYVALLANSQIRSHSTATEKAQK